MDHMNSLIRGSEPDEYSLIEGNRLLCIKYGVVTLLSVNVKLIPFPSFSLFKSYVNTFKLVLPKKNKQKPYVLAPPVTSIPNLIQYRSNRIKISSSFRVPHPSPTCSWYFTIYIVNYLMFA